MANNKGTNTSAVVGLAATAAAAAAAGYFLYGKNAPKRRRRLKGWMLQMKGEVLDRMEKMGKITQGSYENIVDNVAKGYRGLRNVDKAELAQMVVEMKSHWNKVVGQARQAKRGAKKPRRKTA